MTTVRDAVPSDAEAVTAVLTASFLADPVMSWVFDEVDREQRLAAMWQLIGGAGYIPVGASTVLPAEAGVATAAALWMPPGIKLGDEFWAEHAAPFFEAIGSAAERLGQLSEAMSTHHPGDDHWYLLAIGVDPVMQGGGLGSLMLQHTLEIIDERAEPAYLEATSRRSRVLYERNGFEVISEFSAPGGPSLWGMWRSA